MKKIYLLSAVLFSAFITMAQPPKGNADKGDIYGTSFKAKTITNISELPNKLKNDETITGTFKAKIIDVCANKGCWPTLQVNDSTTAHVTMKDYDFFVPLAAKGKTVLLNADASIQTMSVEELKHYAEDAKKSQKEIDAITQPKKKINLVASGIIVVE